jgi:hypothetical protein
MNSQKFTTGRVHTQRLGLPAELKRNWSQLTFKHHIMSDLANKTAIERKDSVMGCPVGINVLILNATRI